MVCPSELAAATRQVKVRVCTTPNELILSWHGAVADSGIGSQVLGRRRHSAAICRIRWSLRPRPCTALRDWGGAQPAHRGCISIALDAFAGPSRIAAVLGRAFVLAFAPLGRRHGCLTTCTGGASIHIRGGCVAPRMQWRSMFRPDCGAVTLEQQVGRRIVSVSHRQGAPTAPSLNAQLLSG